MSLSVSFQPLPTLHACYSVPIEWSYVGNASVQGDPSLKLVFVSSEPSSAASKATVASSSRVASPTSTRTAVSTSSIRPSSTVVAAFPSTRVASQTTPSLARRAPTTTPFTKTVTTLPLSYTSFGWAPIALPSGTYDLSAYLVPGVNGKEQVVGATRGVKVIQGTETACLASSTKPTASTTAATTTSATSAVVSPGISISNGESAEGQKTTSQSGLIGGVVGGVLGALLIVLVLFFILKRRRRRHASLGTTSGGWFRKKDETRGVGSAFQYDFGTLGSAGSTTDSGRRRGTGDEHGRMTEVSGPINVTHVQGFPRPTQYLPVGAQGQGAAYDDYKALEKRDSPTLGLGGIPMVPVLPRRDTDMSTSGFATPLSSGDGYHPGSGGGMEILASATESTYPFYSPSTDDHATSSQSHGRNPSESSYTTGNSHSGLIYPQATRPPVAFPTSAEDNRRTSVYDDPTGSNVYRRPSTTASQRRKSSIAGGGVERSGSVRRKPVPAEAYDELVSPSEVIQEATNEWGARSPDDAAAGTAGKGLVKQKSFVLEVDRPLER